MASSTLLNGVGSNTQLSVWPFYLQRNGVGDELYGAFSAASNLFAILARATSGKLGNINESLPFTVAVLASTGMMFIFAFIPNSLGIALGMILSASSMALLLVGRTILVGRYPRNNSLATTNALLITLGNIGLVVGVAMGAFIFPFSGYFILFLIGGIVCALSVLGAIWLPQRSTSRASRFRILNFRHASSPLRRFYVATCLDTFSWNLALPFFAITPARIFQVTQADIALIQACMFGASTATNVVFAVLSDRFWGRRFLLAASEMLGIVTLVVYLLAPNVAPIFLSAALMGLVFSTWNPVTSAYISEASTSRELNENVGTWQTLTAIVRVPAPIIGGYLAQQWFPRAPYLVALFLVSATGFYIQRYLKEPKSEIRAKTRGKVLPTR